VLKAGQSIKEVGIYAVYARGRVTWDGRGLSEYAQTNPEVQQFRRIGPPTVSLRYQGEDTRERPPPLLLSFLLLCLGCNYFECGDPSPLSLFPLRRDASFKEKQGRAAKNRRTQNSYTQGR